MMIVAANAQHIIQDQIVKMLPLVSMEQMDNHV